VPGKRSFSILEITATLMLVIAAAGIAIPIYRHARSASAARVCLTNLGAIAHAEARFAERTGHYTSDLDQLFAANGGSVSLPVCPLHGNASYTAATSGGAMATVVIRCSNDAEHSEDLGAISDYSIKQTLPGIRAYSR
jgi:hypothetical protein